MREEAYDCKMRGNEFVKNFDRREDAAVKQKLSLLPEQRTFCGSFVC